MWGIYSMLRPRGCSLLTYIGAGHSTGLWVNGLAVGAEDTGIRPLLLIAQGKDLFKLGGNKPAGLQWGVLSRISDRGSREVGLCLRSFIDKCRNRGSCITSLLFLPACTAAAQTFLFLWAQRVWYVTCFYLL